MLQKDSLLLVFNRIPKTGSENMAYVIKEMAKINKFNHIRYGNPDHRLLSRNNQVNIEREYQFENTKIFLMPQRAQLKSRKFSLLGKDGVSFNETTTARTCCIR